MSTNERSVSLLICGEIFVLERIQVSCVSMRHRALGKKDDQCTRTDTGSPQPVFD